MTVSIQTVTRADDGVSEHSTTKKPYVRQMTDKRREQNRRAQKIYRDKLKRKLDGADEPADSSLPNDGSVDSQDGIDVQLPSYTSDLLSTSGSNVIRFEDILASAGDLAIPEESSMLTFQYPPVPPPPKFSKLFLSTTDESPPDDAFTPPDEFPWPLPHRPQGAVYSPPPDATSSYLSGALTTISPTYAYQHVRKRILSQPTHKRRQPNLPSPRLNTLTLTFDTNLSAMISIGLALGISRNAYLSDQPSPFPYCFVHLWPNAIQTNWNNNSVSRFRAGDISVAPDNLTDHILRIKQPLRPSAAQMLDAHPSYLDCIIFPRFRQRAIEASVQSRLDHVEFFLDLMHGGLVCWGAGGDRKKGRRRGMYDQVAWSSRSWEARRWFLDKWSWLVGSEEEEEREGDRDGVWGCSRWWWRMRGEPDSDEEEEDEEDQDWQGRVQSGDGCAAYDTDILEYRWGRGTTGS